MTPPSSAWWRTLQPHHWFVFVAASLAWLFDCLDQQVFNLARDGAVEQLLGDKARATEYASYTTSFFLVGWAIGGLIFGSLGDRFGRARILTVTMLAYSLCTGLSAFATGYISFCFCLLLSGLGVGGVFGLSVTLVADSFPNNARAPALGLLQSLSALGNILAAFIGLGIGIVVAHGLVPFGLKTWQAMFLVGRTPASTCCLRGAAAARANKMEAGQRGRGEAGVEIWVLRQAPQAPPLVEECLARALGLLRRNNRSLGPRKFSP